MLIPPFGGFMQITPWSRNQIDQEVKSTVISGMLDLIIIPKLVICQISPKLFYLEMLYSPRLYVQ